MQDNNQKQSIDLDAQKEIAQLKVYIENLESKLAEQEEREEQSRKSRRGWLFLGASTFGSFFFGRKLKVAFKKYIEETPKGKVSADTQAELMAAILWRFTRIGIFTLLMATIPIIQIYYLYRQDAMFDRQNDLVEQQNLIANKQAQLFEQQNKKFDRQNFLVGIQASLADSQRVLAGVQTELLRDQNLKFDFQNALVQSEIQLTNNQNALLKQQNQLQEASRRSTLVSQIDNIMAQINEELKNNAQRKLSPQLIGNIITLSHSFRPYRNLEGDSLGSLLSPERGQLLIALHNSQIDSVSFTQIIRNASFKYADLREANLNGINLSQANLTGANLAYSFSWKARLDTTNLVKANLNHAYLVDASFQGADLRYADLQFAKLTGANLEGTRIGTSGEVYVRNSYLNSFNIGSTLEFELPDTNARPILTCSAKDSMNLGINNVFFGTSASEVSMSTGSNNFFGLSAGKRNTIRHANLFCGRMVGVSSATGKQNVSFGDSSMSTNSLYTGTVMLNINLENVKVDSPNFFEEFEKLKKMNLPVGLEELMKKYYIDPESHIDLYTGQKYYLIKRK